MKVVALLIFWSLPLFPVAAPGIRSTLSATTDSGIHVTPALIQQPIDAAYPGDLAKVGLGSPCWDEEDSLDDQLIDGGLLPSPLPWATVSDQGSLFAHAEYDLVRPSSHTLPLRC
jgi:hypothetical protein